MHPFCNNTAANDFPSPWAAPVISAALPVNIFVSFNQTLGCLCIFWSGSRYLLWRIKKLHTNLTGKFKLQWYIFFLFYQTPIIIFILSNNMLKYHLIKILFVLFSLWCILFRNWRKTLFAKKSLWCIEFLLTMRDDSI